MRTNLRIKAWILLFIFCVEIFSPIQIMALTSGPSQPEMASFTPAGTTELVNPFTGDFSYNIPLMDVEGYPVNLAYSSGVSMEQEASWVGLGWNLNVGTVNRSVRGLPDDFKGDPITTETNMKDMKITKVGLGAGVEAFGDAKIAGGGGLSTSTSFIYNNYKGIGISYDNSVNAGISAGGMKLKGGVGLNINSLEGASTNTSLGLSLAIKSGDAGSLNFGLNRGTGYNTRTGQKMLSLGTTAGYSADTDASKKEGIKKEGNGGSSLGASSTYLPIGMETYTPYPTLKMESSTISFSATVGGEFSGVHLHGRLFGSQTVQTLTETSKTTGAYGYLNSEEAQSHHLMDFNRDKQVALSKETRNLSPVNFTYDVFSVSGQGISGMFRPFRNDIGLLGDPTYIDKSGSSQSFGAEVGITAFVHAGVNFNGVDNRVYYGRWFGGAQDKFKYEGKRLNSLYEPVFLKAAGDLNEIDINRFNEIGGYEPIAFALTPNYSTNAVVDKNKQAIPLLSSPKEKRNPRSKLLSFLTVEEAGSFGLDTNIKSYQGNFYNDVSDVAAINITELDRETSERKAHHISEITQVNPDGERYVFGIPAYNNHKEEVTYNTDLVTSNEDYDRIAYSTNDLTNNTAGIDHYTNREVTPAYAHSYLLTAKLSSDYRDITGDGVTYDDPGNGYRFNYTRTSDAYKWRVPYSDANFMEGFKSNKLDQKGSYSYGEKELWYVHSIESKNQVAEFYISERDDAVGVLGAIGGMGSPANSVNKTQRLDSIKLYNKYERYDLKQNAVPIKKIAFTYDYSLCPRVENNVNTSNLGAADSTTGKLTLKKVVISMGNSALGALSPYVFNYSDENPKYNPTHVDRWGNYKPSSVNPAGMKNADFPYTVQDSTHEDYSPNDWASAWSMDEIILPSGGKIEVEYEADDYAYVMNERAMQMYPIVGAGNSTVFSNSNELYDNEYLYIDRPESISSSTSQEELRNIFLGEDGLMKDMYFKVLTNIRAHEDYVSGYTDALDIGHCSGSNHLYIKIPKDSPSPITKVAWYYFRQNLFEVLYDQPNIQDSGLQSILKGLAANITDIRQMFSGVSNYLKKKNVARNITLNESFIRLNNYNQQKLGGGSRVKAVKMYDSWNEFVGEGESSYYGQQYDYTISDESGNNISSGVATYEPMIGNDENPFRRPIPYISVAASGHIPAIKSFQELPYGESFFPSASVGYSKVTVKSIHYDKGLSSQLITENNFNTAKDFPVIVDATEIEKLHAPPSGKTMSFPFSNLENESLFAASQGYVIILNDMHGKPKSTINYAIIEKEVGGSIVQARKDISGERYSYFEKNTTKGKILDNQVEVISSKGKLEEKLLGVEYDIAIDSRKSYEKSVSTSAQANVDIIPIPLPPPLPVPIPIPMAYFNILTDIKDARTIVITKVIQNYGIVKSVETFTDQYATTSENVLFDGYTGDVILKRHINEFNEQEYECDLPSYLMTNQMRMGAASENIAFEMNPTLDNTCAEGGAGDYFNEGILRHGDEVIVSPYNSYTLGQTLEDTLWTNPQAYKAWVDIPLKDPIIQSNCKPNKIMYVGGDWITCNPYRGQKTGNISRSDLINPAKEIQLFHLNNKYAGFINQWTAQNHINYSGTGDYIFKDTSASSFCQVFNIDSIGWDNIFHSGWYHPSGNLYGINGLTVHGALTDVYSKDLPNTFDLTDTIQGELLSLADPVDSSKYLIKYDPKHSRYYQHNQLFLTKIIDTVDKVDTLILKDYYFVDYIHPSYPLPVFEKLNNNLNPFLDPQVIDCPNTFRLVKRDGSYVEGLTHLDTLKVIRSGNRNMLTAKVGKVISKQNPLKFDMNNKFLGFKGENDVDLLQAQAVHYSDGYSMTSYNPYGNNFNKFLINSDGNFMVDSSFKYLSSRYQNAEIELKEDGYFESHPELWATVTNECFYRMNPPSFSTVGGSSSGWFPEEKISQYDYNGVSIESQNILDIYSSVKVDNYNLVQSTNSNAKTDQVFSDDFERYEFFGVDNGNTNNPYDYLPKHQGILTGSNIYNEDLLFYDYDIRRGTLKSPWSNLLVKGIAHSGEHSLFLKGVNPGNNLMTIDYNEKPLNYVINYEVEGILDEEQVSDTLKYDTAKTFHAAAFEANLSADVKTEISNGESTSGQNTYEFTFAPDQIHGKYVFSAWVKEKLKSGTPYAGLSPEVEIIGDRTLQLLPGKTEIDGWRKIEGVFELDSLTTNSGKITLKGGLWGAFFDDIRIFPLNSQMSTYVYDLSTRKLKAKLDENNYATFYEYDEQGIPSQVKRETDAGIITIQETRQSVHK